MKFIYDLKKAMDQKRAGDISPADYARICTILERNDAKLVEGGATPFLYESPYIIPDLKDYDASTASSCGTISSRHAGAFIQPRKELTPVESQLKHWREVIVPQLEAAAGMKPGAWDSGNNSTKACLLCWVAYQLGKKNRLVVDMSGKDLAEALKIEGII